MLSPLKLVLLLLIAVVSTSSLATEYECHRIVILCNAFPGRRKPKEFDRIIMRYFQENFLGTEYLALFTETYSPKIAQIQDEQLKTDIYYLARFVVWIINKDIFFRSLEKLFRVNKYAINYFIHRVLGALEFVALTSTLPFIPPRVNLKIIKYARYADWGYFLHPAISRISSLSDEQFKKSLLQLIGRSAWARNCAEDSEFLNAFRIRLDQVLPETSPDFYLKEMNKRWTQCAVLKIDQLLTSPDSSILSAPDKIGFLKQKIVEIVTTYSAPIGVASC